MILLASRKTLQIKVFKKINVLFQEKRKQSEPADSDDDNDEEVLMGRGVEGRGESVQLYNIQFNLRT